MGPVHVLVVDDLPASRGLAAIWLSDGLRSGVEVVEAATLAEMRAAWAAHRPDIVILDQRLPDGEGLDGARELLASDPDATIILLTGMADPALDQEAERIGVADFLVKHEIDGPMLARTVRYALRRREDRTRLRRSEERYRNLVKELPDTGVLVVDEQLRFVMVSGDALDQAGHDTDAMIGRSVAEVLEGAGRSELLEHYRAALGGVAHQLETVSASGRTYRTAFRPLGAEAMAVTFDVTEQLAQAAELQRAQALAHTGSWRWDAATQAMTWSPELCRIYGVDPSQPLPSFAEFLTTRIDPADRDRVMAVTRAAQRDGTEADLEMAILRTDGTRRLLHSRVRPVRGADGAIARIEGISQDVTELRAAQDALRAGEEQLRLVLGNLPRAVVAVYDRELKCTMMEGGTLPAEVYAVLEPALLRALDGEEAELPVAAGDRELEIAVAPHRDLHGQIAGAMALARDVTEHRAAERARQAAEQRFEVVFDRAPNGMFLADREGRFLRVNAALGELTGFSRDELLGKGPLDVVHPDDVAKVMDALEAMRDGDVTLDHRVNHHDGRAVWVSVSGTLVRDDRGEPLYVLGQMQDITERREYEERLRHLADHDPLTGLLNRRGFERALETHVARTRRYGAAGALLLVDLDGFKYINDTLGHHAGDQLIIACAGALRERLRETDVLARLGGDEFAVLLPVESAPEAAVVAAALVEIVRERARGFGGQQAGNVTASIGVAVVEAATAGAGELMVGADLAMYEAKEAGRDQFAVYQADGARQPRIRAQMTWLQRLDRALAEERLVLHAQPIVDLRTRATVRHEILVRMVGEDGELIRPSTFLPAAERFGTITAIDRWVVTEAIRAMGRVAAAGGRLPLAVNVSGRSAGDAGLLQAMATELAAAGVAPADLVVELTETAAVSDIPRAREFTEALRALGCGFALDDFGAGFGSFSYLKHLPFDILKIDGEFVANAEDNETDRLVIAAVTGIAHGLGKTTVAEFVEDGPVIELLLAHGVDFGQGHHLGRPAPLEELLAALGVPGAAARSRADTRA
jgi:diguanylate cyclase (GGDEF)-like protein/PAS domain S-box-containing protein